MVNSEKEDIIIENKCKNEDNINNKTENLHVNFYPIESKKHVQKDIVTGQKYNNYVVNENGNIYDKIKNEKISY